MAYTPAHPSSVSDPSPAVNCVRLTHLILVVVLYIKKKTKKKKRTTTTTRPDGVGRMTLSIGEWAGLCLVAGK